MFAFTFQPAFIFLALKSSFTKTSFWYFFSKEDMRFEPQQKELFIINCIWEVFRKVFSLKE